MILTFRKLRYRVARTKLRVPLVWYEHYGTGSKDVFLASFPRSGNTWLRFQLGELFTGISLGFDDVKLVVPEIGQHRGVRGILPEGGRLIKSHELYQGHCKKAVYLVRDIRDVVTSLYYHEMALGMLPYYGSIDFDDYVKLFVVGRTFRFGSWQDHVDGWLDSPLAKNGDMLLVKFEDLFARTEETLARISKFLGVEADPSVISRVVRNNSLERMRRKEETSISLPRACGEECRFVRKGSVEGWRTSLTASQVALIESYAGNALTRLGYALTTSPGVKGSTGVESGTRRNFEVQ